MSLRSSQVGLLLRPTILRPHRLPTIIPRHRLTSSSTSTPPSPPPPPSSSSPSKPPSKFSSYLPQLSSLSTKSGIPLPSLVLSFALLHELTAILPLVILFFLFQGIGVGGSVIDWVGQVSDESKINGGRLDWRVKIGEYLEEGEKRVDKVARRYGLFGYTKGEGKVIPAGEGIVEETPGETAHELASRAKGSKAAADITNAISAYVVVKALFPLRLAASLALSPGFSRVAIEPLRKVVWNGWLRRGGNVGGVGKK